jgi:hypothetical protein
LDHCRAWSRAADEGEDASRGFGGVEKMERDVGSVGDGSVFLLIALPEARVIKPRRSVMRNSRDRCLYFDERHVIMI